MEDVGGMHYFYLFILVNYRAVIFIGGTGLFVSFIHSFIQQGFVECYSESGTGGAGDPAMTPNARALL